MRVSEKDVNSLGGPGRRGGVCDCGHGLQDSSLWGDEVPSALPARQSAGLRVLRQRR